MTTSDDGRDDDDLRRAFAAERRREAGQAPDLSQVLARAQRPRPARVGWMPRLAVAAVLGAAALFVLHFATLSPPPPRPSPPLLLAGDWTAPTDFLLRTPGLEILETTPRIGSGSTLSLIPGPDASAPAPRQRSLVP
jgi:hypothetical protein